MKIEKWNYNYGLPKVELDTPMPEVKPPKVEKIESFIPIPKIPSMYTEKEETIELRKKIQELSDRILELEHIMIDFHREFISHVRDYDHRLL